MYSNYSHYKSRSLHHVKFKNSELYRYTKFVMNACIHGLFCLTNNCDLIYNQVRRGYSVSIIYIKVEFLHLLKQFSFMH